MVKINLYSSKGVKKGDFSLPKEYEEKENMNLLAQALYVYHDRSHPGNSKVKTRSEVVASTRKIYRQKGTGGARHGDVKAPIFVGGGKSHGPKGIKRVLNLPKKMRNKALNVALKLKNQEKRLVAIDSFKSISKTKDAANLIKSVYKKEVGEGKLKNILVAISEKNIENTKYFRNLKGIKLMPFRNLNVLDVYNSRLVILEKESFIETTNTKKISEKTDKKTDQPKKVKAKKVVKKPVKKVVKKISKSKK